MLLLGPPWGCTCLTFVRPLGRLIFELHHTSKVLFKEVKVLFEGPLPDLFREGQGIVAEGIFQNNNFIASEVLAKHDENYMPPEVADALKKNNVWKGDTD